MLIRTTPEIRELSEQIQSIREQLLELEHERGVLQRLRDSNARARLESDLEAALLELGAAVFDQMCAARGDGSVLNAVETEVAMEDPAPAMQVATAEPQVTQPRFATLVTTPVNPVPVVKASAPAVPVTADVLQDLKSRMLGGQAQPAVRVSLSTTVDDQARAIIETTLEAFGPTPSHLQGKKPVTRELERIQSVLTTQIDTWEAAGPRVNRQLTAWLTARARAAQAEATKQRLPNVDEELDVVFRRLTQHSAVTQPGSIWGLARSHKPRAAGWLADAQTLERELRMLTGDVKYLDLDAGEEEVPEVNLDDEVRRLTEEVRSGLDAETFSARLHHLLAAGASPNDTRLARLAMPFAGELDGPEFSAVRRAVTSLVERDEDTEAAEGSGHIPENWPWLSHTRGKVAVIVGGEPRPERLVRLRSAFDFAELDWLQGIDKAGRSVDSLVQKMRNGTVDLVIVLRAFSSHKVSDKVFGVEDPKCVRVLADTYGINQVRLAIERFCVAEQPAARVAGR
jgi:hypothetical protein